MAATVLKSPRAVAMSVYVIRAFVKMRGVLGDTRALAAKLVALEQELKTRLDTHEVAIVEVLQRIMKILDPPPPPPRRASAASTASALTNRTASSAQLALLTTGIDPSLRQKSAAMVGSASARLVDLDQRPIVATFRPAHQ